MQTTRIRQSMQDKRPARIRRSAPVTRAARPGQSASGRHRPGPHTPAHEHSVPWFWPYAAAIELAEAGARQFQDNLRFVQASEAITAPPPPEWATPNEVRLELDTMRLREFRRPAAGSCRAPVLVDAPYAGHSAAIADFAKGQSLVQTLLESGLQHVLVTDWKAATPEMQDYDIDKYLAEINAAVDDLGGRVHLVGLCQGGWMGAMFAARFPRKVASLVLAGAPIDTDAGNGPVRRLAHALPMSFYEEMVAAGGGRMLGRIMLAGWKDMHPTTQYFDKYLDLYAHVEDKGYLRRTEAFERWYENPLDLPGRYYLQAIDDLFKNNRFARGEFSGLGRKLSLRQVEAPVYLLAGEADDITPPEQVFGALPLLGTAANRIEQRLAPGGHIGLFMGSRTLAEHWPVIGRWIARCDAALQP